MLQSEQEERGRKFKLALRAGLPVIVLIGLVSYGTFFTGDTIRFGLREALIMAGLVFVTTYFIFFLLEEDGQKTLLDHTTGSYNYPALLQRFKKNKPKSLALIIIDNLSTINENYGTRDVDTMLRSFVYQLDATLSAFSIDSATISRKHGAEFIISCNSPSEKIKEAVSSFIDDHPSILNIELDYRYGIANEPKENLEKVIWHLHDIILAPESSKEATKGEKQIKEQDLEKLEQQIIDSINASRLTFSFRPLQSVKKNMVDTYEIMVKLKLDDGEKVLPRIYLPIVNRLGLGRSYDIAILKHVLSIMALIDDAVSFSFNLSPFSLRDHDFQRQAFSLIEESGINPSRLIIELYERKTHHNLEGYLKTLESFRAHGFRICIDNFGSSNASMEYMRHFKFDMVQFDRDFVGNLDDDKTLAMLRSLIEMSQSLQITTVAKWVDKDEQKQKLIDAGIDYLQGFGIGKPLSEEDLINTYN